MSKREQIECADESVIFAEGFDDAIIGHTSGGCVVYDIEKAIQCLMKATGANYQDASEDFFFNTECAGIGDHTPIWVWVTEEPEPEPVPLSPIKVCCGKCDDFIPESEVEFVNIEEDFYGQDLLTFKCPKCGTTQKSLRVGR